MEENHNFIGINIKNLLETKKITVEDFASKLNVEVKLVEKWFSGEEKIAADYLQSISEILGVSYERILNKPKKYDCIDEVYVNFEDLNFFKSFLNVKLVDDKHIYRGQNNSSWPLMSSYCRYCKKNRIKEEENIFKCDECKVDALVDDKIMELIRTECSVLDSANKIQNMGKVSLLAYLQHNGIPTPLLDWSYSPYVALFFAIKDAEPDNQIVLYDFNLTKYESDYPRKELIGISPITILEFPSENINQLNQQGLFMYCRKYPNIEEYFQKLYEEKNGKKYLTKYIFTLSGIEKKLVMESFKRMNITERSLFPDSSHIAKDIIKKIFDDHLKRIMKIIIDNF